MTRRTAFWVVLMLLTGSAFFPGCRSARPRMASPRPAIASKGGLQPTAALLRHVRAPVLGRAVEVKTYLPAKMYEAIDGEADLFLAYDCRELVVGKYRAGRMTATAEVFDQVEPLNAFGVFSQLRGQATPVAVGAAGVQVAGEAVLSWTSHFFVRVSATSAQRPPLTALVALSRAIAAELKGPSSLPAWTKALPRGASGEQYVARNVLGHGFLAHAMIGEYRVGAATCRLALARGSDEAETQDWWRRLRESYHGSTSGKGLSASPSETFRGTDPAGQLTWVTRSGRYLVLAAGDCSENRMRQLLSVTLKRLKEDEMRQRQSATLERLEQKMP